MTMTSSLARPAGTPPPILDRAGDLLARYDVIFCDVWGVVHDGHTAFVEACEALMRFRRNGGTVILVSNAPVPGDRVAAMLDLRAVQRAAWDEIVSSGDLVIEDLRAHGYTRVYAIGPRDRDAALFSRLTAELVPLEEAQAIVCSGLDDDRRETAEDYRGILEAALARRLPFVCANPDLVVDVGGTLLLCAGSIAEIYEHMGGEVFWAGKPHAPAYAAAKRHAEALRGAPVDPSRILVIGDAVRTDIAGAARAGLGALFIASGIHREDLMQDGEIVPERLARVFGDGAPPALAAMPMLRW